MKISLDDHLNDMRMDLDLTPNCKVLSPNLLSVCNFVVDADKDVEDYRLILVDKLYNMSDYLINKYEESFREFLASNSRIGK